MEVPCPVPLLLVRTFRGISCVARAVADPEGYASARAHPGAFTASSPPPHARLARKTDIWAQYVMGFPNATIEIRAFRELEFMQMKGVSHFILHHDFDLELPTGAWAEAALHHLTEIFTQKQSGNQSQDWPPGD